MRDGSTSPPRKLKRDRGMFVRLSAEDILAARQAAESCGTSAAAWVTMLVRRELRRVRTHRLAHMSADRSAA